MSVFNINENQPYSDMYFDPVKRKLDYAPAETAIKAGAVTGYIGFNVAKKMYKGTSDIGLGVENVVRKIRGKDKLSRPIDQNKLKKFGRRGAYIVGGATALGTYHLTKNLLERVRDKKKRQETISAIRSATLRHQQQQQSR